MTGMENPECISRPFLILSDPGIPFPFWILNSCEAYSTLPVGADDEVERDGPTSTRRSRTHVNKHHRLP